MVNPDRVAFTIFGKDIYWYGVLMAIGILIAIWLGTKEERRKNLPKDTILDCCLYMIPLGVVCARLYYVIFEWKYYSQHLIEVFYVWEGGLAFYGALLGGLLGLWLASRHKKLRLLKLMDCIAPGVVLAQAIESLIIACRLEYLTYCISFRTFHFHRSKGPPVRVFSQNLLAVGIREAYLTRCLGHNGT